MPAKPWNYIRPWPQVMLKIEVPDGDPPVTQEVISDISDAGSEPNGYVVEHGEMLYVVF